MANKQLFKTSRGRATPAATTKNQAGGLAYEFTPEHTLAQLAFTGTFSDTYYGKATDQLDALRKAADQVSPTFLAKCAIAASIDGFARRRNRVATGSRPPGSRRPTTLPWSRTNRARSPKYC